MDLNSGMLEVARGVDPGDGPGPDAAEPSEIEWLEATVVAIPLADTSGAPAEMVGPCTAIPRQALVPLISQGCPTILSP